MMIFLLVMMSMNNMIFYFSKTPLSTGFTLLIQTLIISMMSGLMTLSFWYSYILFLIMLGGMLILFIYVSSLTSNQKFLFKKNMLFMVMLIFLLTYLIYLFMKFPDLMNLEILKLKNMEIEQNFILKMSMNKLYNNPTNQVMILLINYLLLTLFIIVKITNINLGPLRKNI